MRHVDQAQWFIAYHLNDSTADLLNAYRQLNVPNRSQDDNSLLNEITGMLSFRLGQGKNIEIPPIVPIAREPQMSGSDSTLLRKQEELEARLNRLQVQGVKEVPPVGSLRVKIDYLKKRGLQLASPSLTLPPRKPFFQW